VISERGSWLVVAWAREVAKSPKAKKKVMAAEVVVGEKGKVTGMVAGQQVVIRGTVSGVICAKTVALQASSQIEGDIHHMSFAIEQGAQFDGRSRRARGEPDLLAVLEGRGTAQSTDA